MYDIALSVAACVRAGTRVDVAWVVDSHGFSSRDPSDALAITPGGGRLGSLLLGALNEALADVVASGRSGRLVEVHVGEADALAAGLSCGGDARCLVVPASDLPADLWQRLAAREPACLVTRLDGDRAVGTALFASATVAEAGEDAARLFARGTSEAAVSTDAVVTVLWPVARMVIVGAGAIAQALDAAARLLGWRVEVATEREAAASAAAGLTPLDKVVVISHDKDVAGPALAAALDGEAGYIGALGSHKTQQARAQWLADRGVTDLSRVHGPAGLDIGANTPAEIAVAILAEALAVRAGTAAVSLRERGGAIHR